MRTGRALLVSEFGKKGAVSEQFSKPALLMLSLAVWHHYALNLSQLDGKATCVPSHRALSVEKLESGEEMVEEFIVWCYRFFNH